MSSLKTSCVFYTFKFEDRQKNNRRCINNIVFERARACVCVCVGGGLRGSGLKKKTERRIGGRERLGEEGGVGDDQTDEEDPNRDRKPVT